MAGLAAAVSPGATVGVDTASFIYHVERHPTYATIVGPFFEALEQGAFRAVTSIVTIMEISAGPLKRQRPDVADDYALLLGGFPNLTLHDVDERLARRAADLRARLRTGPLDSIQLATALEAGATAFLTNDRRLTRVTELEVLLIDTYRGLP